MGQLTEPDKVDSRERQVFVVASYHLRSCLVPTQTSNHWVSRSEREAFYSYQYRPEP
jgi:hypothetical protein